MEKIKITEIKRGQKILSEYGEEKCVGEYIDTSKKWYLAIEINGDYFSGIEIEFE